MSSRTVFKFPLKVSDDFDIILPAAHKIIAVQMQALKPFMWAEVDTDTSMRPFIFAVVGTGHPIPDGMTHVGTWQEPPFMSWSGVGRPRSWHLYEDARFRLDIKV